MRHSKNTILFIFLIITLLSVYSYGYIFDCLDKCICDTDDEVIHCHNNLERTRLQLPEKRLRGFTVLGLTRNDIRVLPSQDILLNIFPDLQAIDVELNPNFECSTLEHYDKIRVLSSCDKNPDEISKLANITTIVDTISEPTKECDLSCQTQRHYEKLHEYFKHLWKIIKAKFGEFTRDSRVFKDVQEFFIEVGKRMSHLANEIRQEFNDTDSTNKSNESDKDENITTVPN